MDSTKIKMLNPIYEAQAEQLKDYSASHKQRMTYSVLRFVKRLNEPGCKSLILLNLRSLKVEKESVSHGGYFTAETLNPYDVKRG